MSYYQFLQIFTLRVLNSALILVFYTLFLTSGIYPSFNERVETKAFSSFGHLKKKLDKNLVKVFCNIGVPLLFKCILHPFKYCHFKVLEWLINKKSISKYFIQTFIYLI